MAVGAAGNIGQIQGTRFLARGVFHGDPHFKNILCDRDGRPYLIDFSFSYVRGSWWILDRWVVRNLRAMRDERLRKIRQVFYGEQETRPTGLPCTYRLLKWCKGLYRKLKRRGKGD